MQGLLDIARAFLQAARSELEEGLTENNYVKVREAAEKAWNAVVQATDHAMNAHGRIPGPGAFAHRSRRTFLEGVGRMDLASDYTYFAERLHGGGCYPEGATVLKALKLLGFLSVSAVRSIKVFEIDVGERSRAGVQTAVEEMCRKLLANPGIHDYRIRVESPKAAPRARKRRARR